MGRKLKRARVRVPSSAGRLEADIGRFERARDSRHDR